MRRQIWPGTSYPLGAGFDGYGTNFALFSSVAERVELCLFDVVGAEERIELPMGTGHVWHAYLPNVGPGQRYGYRVHGPWDPARGLRCNPAKLLADPYAYAFTGSLVWSPALFSHDLSDPARAPNDLDSAPFMLKSVVEQPYFDWGNDRPPRTSWNDTVIYEMHVKGFSIQNPRVPPELRGTYSGLGHPASIQYLQRLGVTAVELLPVHQFVHEGHLLDKGLRNYWGYYTIGYFAPHDEYGTESGNVLAEFKHMVKALHHAGIEVILDVVYNHTAEGNHLGPTLSFRGIDNPAYYRLSGEDQRYYMDYTGTGNTLNMRHPNVLMLLMDSLRYWVEHMHVDGFRFDLASALARELHAVDRLSAFFDVIQQDPIISRAKLIAEPWDVGEGGYQVGKFPPLWSEWNGRYRDCIRDHWRGERKGLAELGYRLTGSSDLYAAAARRPHASINFITAHDGFTLRDLVSYNGKHNQDNGEDNRDGSDDNRSWNCGVEGPTEDAGIRALRARQARNLLVTLFTSQGVPMICAGDEQGHTQGGNNNAYCQDNRTTWLDWDRLDGELLEFTRQLLHFYREHPVFRQRGWFQGRSIFGTQAHDIAWFTPGGAPMTEENWKDPEANVLGVFLNGHGIASPGPRGERILDDSFYIVSNAHHANLGFVMPPALAGRWALVLDTGGGFHREGEMRQLGAGETFEAISHSMAIWKKVG